MEKWELIQENNKEYLEVYKQYLLSKKLSKRTIDIYLGDIDMYINDYMAERNNLEMVDGCYRVDEYFSWYKYVVSTSEDNIKKHCSALKHFYFCMKEHQYISNDDYNEIVSAIKIYKSSWLEELY